MSEPLRDEPPPDEPVPGEPPRDEDAWTAKESSGPDGPGIAPTAMESLVSALLEAGPEVAEHVVRAAQELLAAAQCIVDAADQAVRQRQEMRTRDDEGAAVLPLDFTE